MASLGRPDRKTVEKNRRIQMKALYSQLHSLLPVALTKENKSPLSMPERLDVAATYIKVLQERLDKMKARRRQLLGCHDHSGRPLVHVQKSHSHNRGRRSEDCKCQLLCGGCYGQPHYTRQGGRNWKRI